MESVARDRRRAIKIAGKERVLAVLAPLVLDILSEVRSSDVGEPRHRERYGDPRERADVAANAVRLLTSKGPHADVAFTDDGIGLTDAAATRIRAASSLVRTMKSKSKFEREAMLCLDYISSVRPELLERVASELETKGYVPQWFVSQGGVRVAVLEGERQEDMFWFSYEVTALPDNEDRVYSPEFWDEPFEVEPGGTGYFIKNGIPGKVRPRARGERVWLRYVAAPVNVRKPPWKARLKYFLRRMLRKTSS